MVSKINQTRMGASLLGFWPGLDCALCNHRHHLWLCRLSFSERQNSFFGTLAFFAEFGFQLFFHAPSVWAAKQLACSNRHPAGFGNVNLVDHRHSPPRQMGGLRKHPLPPLGVFRHNFAVEDYDFKLVAK